MPAGRPPSYTKDALRQLLDAKTLRSYPGGILTNKRKDELKLLKVGEFRRIPNGST